MLAYYANKCTTISAQVGMETFMRDKIKVLVVEDELQLAFLMVMVLTRIGCDVEAACTGKRAVELAAEIKFDLITLDIELPDASGFSICTQLKERHISRNTPVIFISAKNCSNDIEEGKKRGAVDYIAKPFDMTELIYRVVYYAKVKASQTTDRGTEMEAVRT
jgi:putative two-component system response regulator